MKAERLWQLTLEHQTTAVVLLRRDLSVIYLNSAAEALLSTSLHSAAGTHVDNLFTDKERAASAMLTLLDENRAATSRDATLLLRDGSNTRVDYTITPLREEQLLLVEMLEINRLLRINREDRSVDAQETSRKLVRGLAHEVKNPLGGIRGAAQLLARQLEQLPNGEVLDEYTTIIIEEADRLTALVDRMLGPIQQPRITPINVHRVLARVAQLIKAEYGDRIQLRHDYDPSLPDVAADESLLVQAILNIVRNAAQALADTEDPTITLQTRVVRQFTIGTVRHRLVAQIDVTDNGPGIPPELYDRIFYPMISGRPEGTGLGLAIAQQIMAQHGGALECESRAGQTRFSVYLPVEATHALTPAAEDLSQPTDSGSAEQSILEQS
ncbi:MAG: nitrogen regulation protein NR(II) [Pseudomonadota bacterium]